MNAQTASAKFETALANALRTDTAAAYAELDIIAENAKAAGVTDAEIAEIVNRQNAMYAVWKEQKSKQDLSDRKEALLAIAAGGGDTLETRSAALEAAGYKVHKAAITNNIGAQTAEFWPGYYVCPSFAKDRP